MADASRLDKLRRLHASFRAQLPDRFDEMRAAWSGALEGVQREESRKEFRRLVHSLAGAAGSFGLPELTHQARQIEELLAGLAAGDAAVPADLAAAISLRLTQLVAPLPPETGGNAPAVQADVQPASAEKKPQCLFLIEDDAQLAEEIASQLRTFGWQVCCYGELTAALQALELKRPEAVIVDATLPEGRLAGIEFIQPARQVAADIPFIVLSASRDWESRLAAARAGSDAYLVKPLDFNILVERVERLTRKPSEDPYRVLILDDTALLAEHYAEVLNAAGMRAVAISEPQRLLDSLDAVQPELVLTDLYMPGCSGIEAARIIRQDERYTGVPIVFLSTESGRQQQFAAMQTGADDFLSKPIHDADLVTAVGLRVARFRALTALIRQDSLTGLLNRIAFDLQAEAEIDRAGRSEAPLALAMLDIDHFKRVNDSYGHPVGDRVIKSLAQLLRKRLRKYDIVGRYGGEEFSILMPDTTLDAAEEVLNALREQFALLRQTSGADDFNCSFSAGLAALQGDMDKSCLVAAADQALYEAKRSGRNQVCRSDPARQ